MQLHVNPILLDYAEFYCVFGYRYSSRRSCFAIFDKKRGRKILLPHPFLLHYLTFLFLFRGVVVELELFPALLPSNINNQLLYAMMTSLGKTIFNKLLCIFEGFGKFYVNVDRNLRIAKPKMQRNFICYLLKYHFQYFLLFGFCFVLYFFCFVLFSWFVVVVFRGHKLDCYSFSDSFGIGYE